MSELVTVEDLTRFCDLTGVALSASGAFTAVARSVPDDATNTYRKDVLVGPSEGPITKVSAGASGRLSLPVWSPVEDRLAVVVRDAQSWSIRISGPTAWQTWTDVVADLPDAVEELSFSPDGRRLMYVVREPFDRDWFSTPEDRRPPLRLRALRYREDGVGWTANTRRQAYVVPISGGAPHRISDGRFDDSQFSWHPDGSSVFFVSQRQPGRERTTCNDVWRMPVQDGRSAAAEQLTDSKAEYGFPRPSPDGRWLSVGAVDVGGYPAPQHLTVLDLASGGVAWHSDSIDRDVHADSVSWRDTDRFATLVDRSGRIELVEVEVATGRTTQPVTGPFQVTAFDVREDRYSLVRSSPVEPPAVLTAQAAATGTGEVTWRPVCTPNAELAATRQLAEPEHRAVTVTDGTTVDSWLVRPTTPTDGEIPVVVWLQGGGTQYGHQWSHEVQLLASTGYAVLYLNARGSAGYGTGWMRAVSGHRAAVPGSGWGGVDVSDVADVVRATLTDHPDLDRQRVGVMGGSYGGLMVTQLLAQTDLFRAGWAERGPYNLISDAGTKDEAPWFFEAYLGADHLTDPESYWLASPLRRVEGITAPLMIVHSENDFRCTIGQAEELFMALRLLDRDVELVRFPGEGHSLTRSGSPVHRLQRYDLLLEWLGSRLVAG